MQNQDIATRDKLIYGRYRPNRYKFGNTASFEGLSADTLSKLVAQNYIDPEANCGDTTVGEVLKFMRKYLQYKAHGTSSGDCTMTIQGVEKGSTNDSVEEFQDYMRLFRNATHFDSGSMYASFVD